MQIHQQLPQPISTNGNITLNNNNNTLAALATQLQRQAAALENAAQLLGSATGGVVSPLLSPINLQQQQQFAATLAQQQVFYC